MNALLTRLLGINPLMIAGIVFLLVMGFTLDWRRIRAAEQRGAAKVIVEAKKKGEAANERADKAHAAARKPGAADRLRRDPLACRDC